MVFVGHVNVLIAFFFDFIFPIILVEFVASDSLWFLG